VERMMDHIPPPDGDGGGESPSRMEVARAAVARSGPTQPAEAAYPRHPREMDEMMLAESFNRERDLWRKTVEGIQRARRDFLLPQTEGGLPSICLEECALPLWRGGHSKPVPPQCHSSCCHGCTYALGHMGGREFEGQVQVYEPGGSGSEVFWGRRWDGKEVFVKFRCVPGIRSSPPYKRPTPAKPVEVTNCQHSHDNYAARKMTQQRHEEMVEQSLRLLAAECGLEYLSVDTWVEHVVSSFPGAWKNWPINQTALISEPAEGMSINSLVNSNYPRGLVIDVIGRVKSSAVRDLALHDLLFSEGDRHSANVFLDPSGKITLIDNDRGLGVMYDKRPAALDSLFLIGTQRFEVVIKGTPSQAWLDYRCHVDGGAIGTQYPPRVQQCMEKFSSMEAGALQAEYDLPHYLQATILKERAADMLRLGFESALDKAMSREKARYEEIMLAAALDGSRPIVAGRTTYRPPHDTPVCGPPQIWVAERARDEASAGKEAERRAKEAARRAEVAAQRAQRAQRAAQRDARVAAPHLGPRSPPRGPT